MANRIKLYSKTSGDPIQLTQTHYLAGGGEGDVYLKKGRVYKIYKDATSMQQRGMAKKLECLVQHSFEGAAFPIDTIVDEQGRLQGVILRHVVGESLCRAFVTPWRDANGFGWQQTLDVVDAMRKVVVRAHSHHMCMVDGNELNWLLHGVTPVAIDVDSWSVDAFKATAIMPSIRDPLIKHDSFNAGSDWFAWAIVTFQLWTGIHPYKGFHDHYPKGALEQRMKDGVSVFETGVRCPAAMRPLNTIPSELQVWYQMVFAHKTRQAPPVLTYVQSFNSMAVINTNVLVAHQKLQNTPLPDFPSRVTAVFADHVLLENGSCVHLSSNSPLMHSILDLPSLKTRALVVYQGPLGPLTLRLNSHGTSIENSTVLANGLWSYGRRVFALVDQHATGLHELSMQTLNGRMSINVSRQWPVVVQATQFFKGLYVQRALDATFIGLLVEDGILQFRASFLDHVDVQDGFYLDSENAWVVGTDKQKGLHFIWHFDSRGQVLNMYEVTQASLMTVALRNGVGIIYINGDLYVNRKTQRTVLAQVTGLDQSVLASDGDSFYAISGVKRTKLKMATS